MITIVAIVSSAYPQAYASTFDPEKAQFVAQIGDLKFSYRTMSLFVVPGEKLNIALSSEHGQPTFDLTTKAGHASRTSDNEWEWIVPASGETQSISIRTSDLNDSMLINIVVMVPFDSLDGEHLSGYRIGYYPKKPYKGLAIYAPPKGFIEVTSENADMQISPHFKLSQFLCKQQGEYPKYVVLREELILKLELLLEEVNKHGISCSSFAVLSGYRTPYYNRLIGNVKYSRHLWGGAADIFIDENPMDGMMDDLNGDGKINWKDAEILYDIIDNLYGLKRYKPFIGGLARYKKTPSHGPFVHVDVRGFRARWGD